MLGRRPAAVTVRRLGDRGASRARPAVRGRRCSQRGGNAPCTSSSNSWVNRARSRASGCRPASSGPARRGRRRSRRALHPQCRARTSTRTSASSSPTLRSRASGQGDDDHLAGARRPLASHPEAHRALDDLEALLLLEADVLAARDPPVRGKLEVDRQQARRACSPMSGGRPVHSRAGFSSVCPVWAIVAPIWSPMQYVQCFRAEPGLSMTTTSRFMLNRPHRWTT